MTYVHLSTETLEAYVEGQLAAAEEARVESDASACAACGAALRREAGLQLALPRVERGLQALERRRLARRALPAFALTAAAGLLLTLWLGRGPAAPGVDVAAAPLALIAAETDSTVRDALIEEALRAGFAVPDGPRLLVPRYELGGGDTSFDPDFP